MKLEFYWQSPWPAVSLWWLLRFAGLSWKGHFDCPLHSHSHPHSNWMNAKFNFHCIIHGDFSVVASIIAVNWICKLAIIITANSNQPTNQPTIQNGNKTQREFRRGDSHINWNGNCYEM